MRIEGGCHMQDPIWYMLASQDPSGDGSLNLHLMRAFEGEPVAAQLRAEELLARPGTEIAPPPSPDQTLGVMGAIFLSDPPQSWVALELSRLFRKEGATPIAQLLALEAGKHLLQLHQGRHDATRVRYSEDASGTTWMWIRRSGHRGQSLFPCGVSTRELNAALENPEAELTVGQQVPESVRQLLGSAANTISDTYMFGGLITDHPQVGFLGQLRKLSLVPMQGSNPAEALHDNLVRLCVHVSFMVWTFVRQSE